MDPNRFDAILKALANDLDRRRVVRGLAGAAFGLLTGRVMGGTGTARAGDKKDDKKEARRLVRICSNECKRQCRTNIPDAKGRRRCVRDCGKFCKERFGS